MTSQGRLLPDIPIFRLFTIRPRKNARIWSNSGLCFLSSVINVFRHRYVVIVALMVSLAIGAVFAPQITTSLKTGGYGDYVVGRPASVL